jgi:hypothetical protein
MAIAIRKAAEDINLYRLVPGATQFSSSLTKVIALS